MAYRTTKEEEMVKEIDRLRSAISTSSDTAGKKVILRGCSTENPGSPYQKDNSEISLKQWGEFKIILEKAMKSCLPFFGLGDCSEAQKIKEEDRMMIRDVDEMIEDLEVISSKGTCILTLKESVKDIFHVISEITFKHIGYPLPEYFHMFNVYPVLPSKVPVIGILYGIPHCFVTENYQSLTALIQKKMPCLDDISINYKPFSSKIIRGVEVGKGGHHFIQGSALDLAMNHNQLWGSCGVPVPFVWKVFEIRISFELHPRVGTYLSFYPNERGLNSGRYILDSRLWP